MVTSNRTQVMIFGTYHMHNPNLDYVKANFADVLAEPRQQQIAELVTKLEGFAPGRVAVETLPERAEGLNDRYRRYLEGDYALTRNEIEQVGFRLARAMGHKELYGIDHQQEIGFDGLFQYMEAHKLTDVSAKNDRLLTELTAQERSIEAEGTIIDLLRYMNSKAHDNHHQVYLRFAQVGAGDSWVGASAIANWYARNLKIYANILKLVQCTGDRIFVLVGAGHTPLLREFLRQTPEVELIHPESYLA